MIVFILSHCHNPRLVQAGFLDKLELYCDLRCSVISILGWGGQIFSLVLIDRSPTFPQHNFLVSWWSYFNFNLRCVLLLLIKGILEIKRVLNECVGHRFDKCLTILFDILVLIWFFFLISWQSIIPYTTSTN